MGGLPLIGVPIETQEDTGGSIKSRGHTGRGEGNFSGKIRILIVIFIQVQTTDGLCHNRALTVGGLSPPKLKTQREITGIRETTRRTSRRVTITPSQKKTYRDSYSYSDDDSTRREEHYEEYEEEYDYDYEYTR